MSNKYYNSNNPLIPGTLARAEDLNDTHEAIATGFELVEADIDLANTDLARKDGAIYTGLHNFTGGTVTVAAPTIPSHAVTKQYADTLAFQAGDVPDQAGNAGNIITTDGTNIFWQNIDEKYVPDQATHAGKFLTTDGTDSSWATITLGDVSDAGNIAAIDTNDSTTQYLRGDGTWAGLPASSTSAAGIVQLNNTLTSTSTTQALTAAQGKALNDKIAPRTAFSSF